MRQIRVATPLLLAFGVAKRPVVLAITPGGRSDPTTTRKIVQDAIVSPCSCSRRAVLPIDRGDDAVAPLSSGSRCMTSASSSRLAIQIDKPFPSGLVPSAARRHRQRMTWATKIRTKAAIRVVPNSSVVTIRSELSNDQDTRVEPDRAYRHPPNECEAVIRKSLRGALSRPIRRRKSARGLCRSALPTRPR